MLQSLEKAGLRSHRIPCTGPLLALAAVLAWGAGEIVAPSHAEAQGVTKNRADAAKTRKAQRRPQQTNAEKSGKTKAEKTAARAAPSPLVVTVSLSRQRLTVYDGKSAIASSPISSGRVGYATPTGVFTVVQKRRQHYSNLYNGASMPNMQRLTWSGVALHAGPLPGYPASHGCIRLPHGFSKKLFGMTSMGTRVIVARDPVAPQPIAHEHLFGAYPPEATPEANAAVKVAEASPIPDTASSVSSVLGVSSAAAAETSDALATIAPDAMTRRAAYHARLRREADARAAETRAAEAAEAEASATLAERQKEAAEARAALTAARLEADARAKELEDLEQAKARVDRELAELQKPEEPAPTRRSRKRKAKKPMDPAVRDARILELNDELKGYPAQAEAARAASAAATAAREPAEVAAKDAEAKRTATMNVLAAAHARLSRARAQEAAAQHREAQRHLPVSVFVSRAKQRLYVRQGYEDIFDVEIGLDRPDEPIGTHVFTALAYTPEKTAMTWSVTSVPHNPSRTKSKKAKAAAAGAGATASPARQTAAAALDRLTIPEDARVQIEDVMKPGSSLVISDLPIGNETGAYTDFIVPIR